MIHNHTQHKTLFFNHRKCFFRTNCRNGQTPFCLKNTDILNVFFCFKKITKRAQGMYAMNTIVSSPYTKVRVYAKLDKYNDVSLEIFYSYTKQERATDETGNWLEFSRAIFLGFLYTFYNQWYKDIKELPMENNQTPRVSSKGKSMRDKRTVLTHTHTLNTNFKPNTRHQTLLNAFGLQFLLFVTRSKRW